MDEIDEFIDVHKVRVATAAATHGSRGGSMPHHRPGSLRSPKMGLSEQGQETKNKLWQIEEQLATHSLNGDALTATLQGLVSQN